MIKNEVEGAYSLSLEEYEKLQEKHSFPALNDVLMNLLVPGTIYAKDPINTECDDSDLGEDNTESRPFYITAKMTFFNAYKVTASSEAEAIKKILNGDYDPDESEDFSGEGNYEIEGDGIVCIGDDDFELPDAPPNNQVEYLRATFHECSRHWMVKESGIEKTFYVTLKNEIYSGIKILAASEDEARAKYLNTEYESEDIYDFYIDDKNAEVFYVGDKRPLECCLPPNAMCRLHDDLESPFMPYSILNFAYCGKNYS